VNNRNLSAGLVRTGTCIAAGATEGPFLKGSPAMCTWVTEVANPEFSSNTTRAGAADLDMVKRGNGTLVRMRPDGRGVAVRQVDVPGLGESGADVLAGIAVAPDASRLWLIVSGALADYASAPGGVLEVPAFGAAGA
jgi:hypothetical protein